MLALLKLCKRQLEICLFNFMDCLLLLLIFVGKNHGFFNHFYIHAGRRTGWLRERERERAVERGAYSVLHA
jgi:hypothetical protein